MNWNLIGLKWHFSSIVQNAILYDSTLLLIHFQKVLHCKQSVFILIHIQKVTKQAKIMKGSRPLTRQQVKEVLRVTDTIREKSLLTLGFCTGYRVSELLSLTVADVSTGGAVHSHVTVKAANTKTKTSRSITLNSDAKKALSNLLQWLSAKGLTDKATPLFLSRKRTATGENKAINRQQAHEIIKALFAKIGEFGNVSTHTMRKTFAKAIYDATGKLELVQIALGHKSINSTVSYLDFGNDAVDNAIHAMEY